RPDLPIYLAAVGPKNVALAAEIADGWIPTFFSVRRIKMFREWLDAGFRARGAAPAAFDIMPMVAVVVGDDVAACRAGVKARLALYVGGMGARGRNFYNDIARRYGYEEAARTVQDLYLAGRKAEADAAVPDALVVEVDVNEASAKATVEQIERAGGQALAVRADVTRAADNQMIVEKAVAAWGSLDVFFANAGVPQSPENVEDVDEALFDRIMAVN